MLRRLSLAFFFTVAAGGAAVCRAQSAEEFYKSRQVNFIVASGPGGGYDTYGRALARNFGRHLPGNVNVVVQNMPGADGLRAANYIYSAAARDGTVLGNTYNTTIFEPLFGGPGVRFDPIKTTWLGSMGKQDLSCVTWKDSPIKTIEDAKMQKVRVSSTGASGNRYIVPRIVNALLGTKFEVVSGYDTFGAFLAVERGEVDGICGISYASLKAAVPHWLDGKLNFLLQFSLEPNAKLGKTPMIGDLVVDPKDKQALSLVLAMQEVGRPIIAPPDLPPDRAAVLERAFAETMTDPQFLTETQKENLEIDPLWRARTEAIIKNAYATAPDIVSRVATLIGRGSAH